MSISTYCSQMIAVITLTTPLICNGSDALANSASGSAKDYLQTTQSSGSSENHPNTPHSQRGKNNTLATGDLENIIAPTSATHSRCSEGKSFTRRGCRIQRGKNHTVANSDDLENIIAPASATYNRCAEGKSFTRRGCRSQRDQNNTAANSGGLENIIVPTSVPYNRCSEGKSFTRRGCRRSQKIKANTLASRSVLTE